MQESEFGKIVVALKAVYTDKKFLASGEAVSIWFELLKDLEYNTTMAAVQKYMVSERYPPTVADIRKCYSDLTEPQLPSELEAWSIVKKAIRDSSYNSQKEYDRLPEIIQKAVGDPETLRSMALDEEYNEMVAQSNFIKSYRTVAQRDKEMKRLPASMRQAIETINAKAIEQTERPLQIETKERDHSWTPMSGAIRERLNKIIQEMKGEQDVKRDSGGVTT